jgi:esterase/lipase superfamily enzyme
MTYNNGRFSLIACLAFPLLVALTGCASKPPVQERMMPTPVLYSAGEIDPFAHLPREQLTTQMRVFYATNRVPEGTDMDPQYGNGIGSVLHIGDALVRFGDDGLTWAELDAASRQAPPDVSSTDTYRTPEVPMYLVETRQMDAIDTAVTTDNSGAYSEGTRQFAAAINKQLAQVDDKQIMLYVHGAKQNFYKSVVFTAEVSHFMGRDLVGIGYAWPTHQGIIEYGIGIDVKRAHESVEPLINLIELLAATTDAQKINIVSWSAGARVLSRTLATLRARNAELDEQGLQEKFRLGAVIFAAADVPKDEYIQRLPNIHAISGRLTVFESDDDGVLKFGQTFMKGGERAGQLTAGLDPEEVQKQVVPYDKLEIIDVSHFQDDRGFDITGHRYWYTNSWANTDILMNIRTSFGPEERGLQSIGISKMWGFPADYPERVSDAIKRHLQEQPDPGKKQWQ